MQEQKPFRLNTLFYDLHRKMFDELVKELGLDKADIIRRSLEFYYTNRTKND